MAQKATNFDTDGSQICITCAKRAKGENWVMGKFLNLYNN